MNQRQFQRVHLAVGRALSTEAPIKLRDGRSGLVVGISARATEDWHNVTCTVRFEPGSRDESVRYEDIDV